MTKFVLPKTIQARNWVRSTDALRAHLSVRLSSIRSRADAKRKEADEIEREGVQIEAAIQLLDQLLPGNKPKSAAPAVATGQPWSRVVESCIGCGTTDRPHVAHGRCQPCDFQWRRSLPARAEPVA